MLDALRPGATRANSRPIGHPQSGCPAECKKVPTPRTTLDVERNQSMPQVERSHGANFEEVLTAYGAALERLAFAYEADPETRRDLL